MAAPAPSAFKAVIVKADDDLGTAFVKVFIRFPILLLQWFKTWYREDGQFTDWFIEQLCNLCKEKNNDA